jgi:C-3',4' desaturase CrtD
MINTQQAHTIVIGAGVGGLTAAALLLKAGHRVTVLEAHIYPGGSAGTFFHKGYRFDAGATLAGGFQPGGPHARLGELLGLTWQYRPVDPAWVVHLPGQRIVQWADPEQWRNERQRAFPGSENFWRTQEHLARLSWKVSSRHFPWPPASYQDWISLAAAFRPSLLGAAPYIFNKVSDLLPHSASLELRTFLDAQLMISAQTTSAHASALYGSAALDLPRRGVNYFQGGIGSLAKTLADWIKANGGEILYRQEVKHLHVKNNRVVGLSTNKGLELSGDIFVGNLTPWGLHQLLGADAPTSLSREITRRKPTWGGFLLYLGLQADQLPPGIAEGCAFSADHHQVVVDPQRPLGEGNSVFISLSPLDDPQRAPAGMRAATLSTHTVIAPWWQLKQNDPDGYARRKEEYTQLVLSAAERAIPGFRAAARFILPGTPVSFQYYTSRPQGMVGGFAQTSLFHARGPASGLTNLWLVGDSVFPGQSTAGVTIGAMRVATSILQQNQVFRFSSWQKTPGSKRLAASSQVDQEPHSAGITAAQ